jgi:hypothetical protein
MTKIKVNYKNYILGAKRETRGFDQGGERTEKSAGKDITKETLTKLNLALQKKKEKAILAAKKKKKKLNMEAELKEFRKQEKESKFCKFL